MSASITYLYDLREEASMNVTVDQITSIIIFGSMGIAGLYDPDHVYNKGDIVPFIDEDGVIHIYECINTGATGSPINLEDWQEYSIIGKLKELRKELIFMDYEEPIDTNSNKIWLKIKGTNPNPSEDRDGWKLIIKNNFIISTTEPDPFTTDLVWGKVTQEIL